MGGVNGTFDGSECKFGEMILVGEMSRFLAVEWDSFGEAKTAHTWLGQQSNIKEGRKQFW